jgi:hypothetical protein
MLFKTTPFGAFVFFFFLKQWIKQRSFTQNEPFCLKENDAKNMSKSKSSLICDLFNQILNCNFDFQNQFNCILTNSIADPKVGRLFQIGPWS